MAGEGTQSKSGPLIPLVVACPAFLQNVASSSISIALPSIAAALGVSVLQLDIAVTAYILSIALFLPASAWLADRFGAKRMFCLSIILFCGASALCGFATSVTGLVVCRVGQGMGAALMMPVGRLILLRTVPQSQIISAMVWYTLPPVVGRLSGPLIGGLIVSVMSWQGIFFVNIPFGIAAVVLAWIFIEDDKGHPDIASFDFMGFALLAGGLTALLWTVEVLGKGKAEGQTAIIVGAAGLAAFGAYLVHNVRRDDPVIDLRILGYRTFRANVMGAAPLRIAIAANPFLLPLMFQLGFGLSPLTAGLFAAAAALGSLCTRLVLKLAIDRFDLKTMLIISTLATALIYGSYSLFTEATPHWIIFATLFAGGLISSLCMLSLNTLGFGEIPKDRTSHASALLSMAQQLLAGIGIVIAVWLLSLAVRARGGAAGELVSADFSSAFIVVGAIALVSAIVFARINPEADLS